MSTRVNHPLKSLLLFLVVAGIGYAAYEYIHKRGILKTTPDSYIPTEVLERLREKILEVYREDACLVEVGRPHWRPKEDRYRVDIRLEDGCEDNARAMCRDIAEMLTDMVDRDVEVWAFSEGASALARYIP